MPHNRFDSVGAIAAAEALQSAFNAGQLIFDGGMGTEIYRRGVFTNCCYDELNLSRSKLIREIHHGYLDAGADVLTTNTFGANRWNLEKYGLADRMDEINRAGVRLVRQVVGDSMSEGETSPKKIFVAGSVGPIAAADRTTHSPEEIAAVLTEQVGILIAGGVDFIFFETLPSREGVVSATEAMRPFAGFPFILSVAITSGTETANGEPIERLLAPGAAPPIAWGINCGLGPDGMLEPLTAALAATSLPIVVQPNAGQPKEFEGRQLYYCSPEYIATYAMQYARLGAAGVGGCCGTTAEHIAEIARMVKRLPPRQTHVTGASFDSSESETVTPLQPESEFASRSRLAEKLARGEWITTVELLPPRGYDLTETVEKTRRLADAQIDAVNLPDGPRASSRISALAVAERILHLTGLEPILHFCCRDKNLVGMQADLLAAAAYGVRNILFITGDPPKVGNLQAVTGVFDTDSIGITRMQKRLNGGVDLGGQPISPPTHAVIGVGLDPTSLDGARERDRFRKKIDAGAAFAITQPVFDPDALLKFFDKLGEVQIPILAGIWPLASYRNAVFMQNEVPGVIVPDEIMNRMEAASHHGADDQRAIGIEIARTMIERIRSRIAGVQVSAPLGRIETSLAVLAR